MATDASVAAVRPATLLGNETLDRDFARILAANAPALSRLAASYTNTAGDRDDLLQEIALAIWKALPAFRHECSERTFVFRIAHNRGIAWLSRARSEPAAEESAIEPQDPAPNPELELALGQRADRLRRAINRLPIVYRQVITLTLEDLGYGEISEVLGISESNVGARLTRARKLLREFLEENR